MRTKSSIDSSSPRAVGMSAPIARLTAMFLHVVGWTIIAASLWAAWRRFPNGRATASAPRNVTWIRVAAGCAAAVSIGLVFITVAAGTVTAALALLFSALAFGLLRRALGRLSDRPGFLLFGSTSAALIWDMRRQWQRTRRAIKRLLAVIAPAGWAPFRLPADFIDRVLSGRTLLLVYGLAIAASPLLLAAFAVIQLNRTDPVRATMLLIYGHASLLLTIACVTLAATITSVAVIIASFVGVLEWRPMYRRSLTRLAACSGGGTIVGALVGALVPLAAFIYPTSGSPPGTTAFDAARPDLLFELTGLGAVMGFLVGEFAFVLTIAGTWPNLLFRWTLVPLLFCTATWGLASAGVNPEELIIEIVHVIQPHTAVVTAATDVSTLESALSTDWRVALVLVGTSGSADLAGPVAFPALVGGAMSIACACGFATDLWRRTRTVVP